MDPSTKIIRARLLYADFIDNGKDDEIIGKIKEFGFTEKKINEKYSENTVYNADNITEFIGKLRSTNMENPELLNYIEKIAFQIYRDDILPLNIVVVVVTLKIDCLQKLEKDNLERQITNLSLPLGEIFSEKHDFNKYDFSVLNFSSRAIKNVRARNAIVEFFIETDNSYFNNVNNLLHEMKKQPEDGYNSHKFNDLEKKIVSWEPLIFLGAGRSSYQSIVVGLSNEMFIIGKIGQSSLMNSGAMYIIIMCQPGFPRVIDPPLEFPSRYLILDFSSGGGQLLMMQLLNSWNRYVEMSIKKIANKRNTAQIKTKKEVGEILKELQDLILYNGIDKKISVNYMESLQNLADPSNKTFLREISIRSKEFSRYLPNPEQFGLEKPGQIVSDFASLILKNLDLNEKNLLDSINLRISKIDALKIDEDRKYSKRMLCFTVVIAAATIINIILYAIRRI